MPNIHISKKDILSILTRWIIWSLQNLHIVQFLTSINMHWKSNTSIIACIVKKIKKLLNYMVDRNYLIINILRHAIQIQKKIYIINNLRIRCEISRVIKYYMSKLTTFDCDNIIHIRNPYLLVYDIRQSTLTSWN